MGLHNSFPSMFYSSVLFVCLLLSNLSAQDIILSGHVYTGASSNGVLIPVEGVQVGIAMDSNKDPESLLLRSLNYEKL